jgi:hypothetical protein
VIITPADAPKGVTLQVGQTLEVALPFGQRQSIAPAAGGPALLLNTPAGYGDASLKSCVWRFTAEQAGQTLVTFSSAPICKPGIDCPQYVAIRKITVTVT